MKNSTTSNVQKGMISTSRRAFSKRSTTAVAGSLVTGLSIAHSANVAGSDAIRVGLVGCGGRGTGAATQVLNADRGARLVAMSDAFRDRLQTSLRSMKQQENIRDRVLVDSDHQFTGFDGYQRVIASDVDVVLLATPPHFRPMHLKACIEAGKHVFVEKPVAVVSRGSRSLTPKRTFRHRDTHGMPNPPRRKCPYQVLPNSSDHTSLLDGTTLQPSKRSAQMEKCRIRSPIPCENDRG